MRVESHDARTTQDLAILRATHVHALLVGPPVAVAAAIETLRSDLRQPVVTWTPTETPHPPVLTSGTLIVRNLAALEREQQRWFLEWLDQGDRRVQIISTSGRHVWSLVERGAFLKPLYYRLGVVYVDLNDASADV